jgi:hypothetical protein
MSIDLEEKSLKQRVFLEALALTGVIAEACAASGTPRSTQYEWRQDPDFKARFDEAMEIAADALESEARRRAIEGTPEPVIHQGQLMHLRNPDGSLKLDENFEPIPFTVHKKSDQLLVKMLEAKREQFRRQRVEVTGKDGEPVQQVQTIHVIHVESDGNGRPAAGSIDDPLR